MKSRIGSGVLGVLFVAVVLFGVSAFAQTTGCIVTPTNPCPPPVIGGKGVVAPPVNLGVIDLSSKADYAKPDVTVTPNAKVASEGSPMPVCQPCHPGCSENERDLDRQKLSAAFKAAFGLS